MIHVSVNLDEQMSTGCYIWLFSNIFTFLNDKLLQSIHLFLYVKNSLFFLFDWVQGDWRVSSDIIKSSYFPVLFSNKNIFIEIISITIYVLNVPILIAIWPGEVCK